MLLKAGFEVALNYFTQTFATVEILPIRCLTDTSAQDLLGGACDLLMIFLLPRDWYMIWWLISDLSHKRGFLWGNKCWCSSHIPWHFSHLTLHSHQYIDIVNLELSTHCLHMKDQLVQIRREVFYDLWRFAEPGLLSRSLLDTALASCCCKFNLLFSD